MRKILVVVDMQRDFIDGSLGTKEAQSIVEAVKEKIRTYEPENVVATRDTHPENYLKTYEGKHLPVEHCIEGTDGWQLYPGIDELLSGCVIFDKPTFGSVKLAEYLKKLNAASPIEVEIVGLCTDI